MAKIYNYFEKLYNENKITQAFLIGNAFYDEISEEINNVLKKFIFQNEKNIENNSDVIVLKNEDTNKDAIKKLLKEMFTTSQFNNKKVYIIDESEKLSDKVYNAILKTLEEPPENVYAFLITNNIESVKPTISSRCQKIFISQAADNKINEFDNKEVAIEIIKNIEENKQKTIAFNSEIYSQMKDKDKLNNILYEVMYIYRSCLNNIVKDNNIEEFDYIKNKNVEILAKKILLIDKYINLVDSHLNKNLFIDRLIIEMWRCEND